jgi:hypothetical protein
MNSAIVTILLDSNFFRPSKSLSPVIKKSAFESFERESRKLSLISLQTNIHVTFNINKFSIFLNGVSLRFSVSSCEKTF